MPLPPSLEEKTEIPGRRRRFALIALRVVFASVIAFFLSQIKLDYLEGFLYDLRVRTRAAQPTSGNVELVLLDSLSVQKLKSDMKASILTSLLEKLKTQEPRFVVLDIRMEELKGTLEEKKALAEVAANIPGLFVVSNDLVLKGEENSLTLIYPFEKVPVASAPKTSDLKIFAKDNVTRRMLVSYQEQPLLHAKVAATYNPTILDLKVIRGQFDFAGSQQVYIDFRPTGSYPRHSFSDVLDATMPAGALRNKVVIVGQDTAQTSRDYILTPYSREIMAMPSAEMHANMFDTMILNSAPRMAPTWLNAVLILFISILTIHVVLSMKPTAGLLLLGETLLGFTVLCYVAFWPLGVWIPMAAPVLAIFLCYYFFIPYRLIVENRRSWEYYQKNKLLSQVEELKTNFISMMSHDLKTPIARIQGMTDVILTDTNAISSQQREAVDTIKHSADDLLKFISAILNYGRIESEGVQLHLQSKDINNVLKEVIRKHEFLAKVKRIQIVSELEPMFPIPMDSDLMKQVLSNLVENAIKYSPEDTKIMVSSEEKGEKVVIQVADQGPGIPAEELNNIFMKFFRSKNAKSSPIKGSGLGLYLAKYFTELHQGNIFVESNYGNGSTFTVELPIKHGGIHA
ncbi:CHASE2 and HATPase_c domain-containing protein [Bdellovibrio svalbardensis]|uniref:histidine kinase n=1 Tax=Bdellovibrio svalbardensis TaxID=2972972 RepID=A0ABT6DHJ2_9BACT|nr:CHASE2 and HATPase_c domain-containing protein [Bdellovibrio svalbardensis]MDG0815389.1 CHASE2 and HATPase_c domain-containing protein [Bdellovibrio svalbardensis]